MPQQAAVGSFEGRMGAGSLAVDRQTALSADDGIDDPVGERPRDPLLPADLAHRQIAPQAGEHDLQLLLRPPAPILPLLAQSILLAGRAAHPEPVAGRPLPAPPPETVRRTYTRRQSTQDWEAGDLRARRPAGRSSARFDLRRGLFGLDRMEP